VRGACSSRTSQLPRLPPTIQLFRLPPTTHLHRTTPPPASDLTAPSPVPERTTAPQNSLASDLHPIGPILHPSQMLRYSRIQVGGAFAGGWLLAYACSAALFLFVEKPFMQMEMLLFKRLGVGAGGE
jgi:hypothetical protein